MKKNLCLGLIAHDVHHLQTFSSVMWQLAKIEDQWVMSQPSDLQDAVAIWAFSAGDLSLHVLGVLGLTLKLCRVETELNKLIISSFVSLTSFVLQFWFYYVHLKDDFSKSIWCRDNPRLLDLVIFELSFFLKKKWI